MDWKQITGLVMGVVIGVLLLTTLAMPVISDATTTEKTFTNEGLLYYDEVKDDLETTIFWDHTKPSGITMGGEFIELPLGTPYALTLMFSDDWMLRGTPSDGNTPAGVDIMEVNTANTGVYIGANTNNNKDLTITISEGTATFYDGTNTKTKSIDGGLILTTSDDPAYALKSSTSTSYILDDSAIYGAGRTDRAIGSGTYLNAIFAGSIEDGMTVVYSPNTWTIGDITIDYEDVTSYISLNKITSFHTTASYNDASGTITYSQFFVPYKVTAELAEHLDSSTIQLLSIIPLLITVGIILAVVGVFVMRRE